MRPLNQYMLFGGPLTAIESTEGSGVTVCVPTDGRIVGCVMNTQVLIDAETTFDIFVDDVDSGVDFVLPDTTADNAGLLVEMRVAHSVAIKAGDSIHLTSNQEQTAAGTVEFCWILERDAGNDAEFYLNSPVLNGIEGAVTSASMVVPYACQLVGIAMIPHTVISTAGGDHTFDIQKNGADTTTDAVLPDGQADEDGLIMGLTGPRVFLEAGDQLRIQSNAEQIAATNVDYTYIFRKTGERNLSTRDERVYALIGGGSIYSTINHLSSECVVAEAGQIVGVALTSNVVTDAETEFELVINTVVQAGDIFVLGATDITTPNEGLVLHPLQTHQVNVGDSIQLRASGDQIVVASGRLTWLIRR